MATVNIDWSNLKIEGELHTGSVVRKLYSTDASEFQEMPLAVAIPRSESDVRKLIKFALRNRVGLVPRTAGTSLAGQVVGNGIVVDLGRQPCGQRLLEPYELGLPRA